MNSRDAISENDYYIGLTEPTYYCEQCQAPMGSPSVSGLCWDCEREREQPYEDEE